MTRRLGARVDMQDAEWPECLIGLDRRRMLCSFGGTEASAVHKVSRRARAGLVRHWAGRVYTPERSDLEPNASSERLANILAERTFETPITLGALAALERSCTWCATTHRVLLMRLVLSHDGRRALALFRAPDAESVRLAYRNVKPFDRVWAYRRIPIVAGFVRGLLTAPQ